MAERDERVRDEPREEAEPRPQPEPERRREVERAGRREATAATTGAPEKRG